VLHEEWETLVLDLDSCAAAPIGATATDYEALFASIDSVRMFWLPVAH
jgi:hypothetical protein